jgi:hypothetical protein
LAPVTDWNLRSLDKVKPRKQYIVVEKKNKKEWNNVKMHNQWDPGSWFLPECYKPVNNPQFKHQNIMKNATQLVSAGRNLDKYRKEANPMYATST